MDDKKKYTYMENVLQAINKNYISLAEEEVKRNNKVLEEVLNQVVSKMKEKNALFKQLFTRVFYGGSYYDGLRVGNPEEFDLDLLLSLPKYAEPELTNSNIPGFVHLQLKAMEKFEKQPEAHCYSGLANLFDERHYLVTTKVSPWIEGIVTKALNDFEKSGSYTLIKTSKGTFKAKTVKGGPAFTLKLEGNVDGKPIKMDVDLVPCFSFTKEKWPPSPYRKNPVEGKPEFFIVPKKPGGPNDVQRYWRLSFQEQERVLINNNRTLKPTVKLFKKLRDMDNHSCIASYFIKTIFLWEIEKEKDQKLWDNSLSYVFMTMLKTYKDYIEKGKIPYYWNKNNNLIQKTSAVTAGNIANRLKGIIDDIEKHPSDPYVVAKYLVQSDKIEKLKSETVIGKKTMKQLQQLQISSETNGMTSTTQSTSSSYINIKTANPDLLLFVNEIVQNCLKQTDNSTKNSFSSKQKLTSAEPAIQKSKSFTVFSTSSSSANAASCSADEMDSARFNTNRLTENTILKAINKLQDTTNNLTVIVSNLQYDNQRLFNCMNNLSIKINEIGSNIEELTRENRMLKRQLNIAHAEKQQNGVDDFCFLTDTLTLTANHSLL